MPETRGVIYQAFGPTAVKCCGASIASLRQHSPNLDILVVSDRSMHRYGVETIPWPPEIKVWRTRALMRRGFMSGVTKPKLYGLSPFDRTLYLDADTTILADVTSGFAFLDDADMAIWPHRHSIPWYVRPRPGANPYMATGFRKEIEHTIKELGAAADLYWNAGVIFWRKSPATKGLFDLWGKEWRRFKSWNEQMALRRAAHQVPELRVVHLGPEWNNKKRESGTIIWHVYGTGRVDR
jgi:hypothetical protein